MMRLTNCQLIEWRVDNNIFLRISGSTERYNAYSETINMNSLIAYKSILFIGCNSVFDGYSAQQHSASAAKTIARQQERE